MVYNHLIVVFDCISDSLQIEVRICANWPGQCLKVAAGMWSGPAAFPRLRSCYPTSSSSKIKGENSVTGLSRDVTEQSFTVNNNKT